MNKTIITKEQLENYVLGPGVTVAKTWSTKPTADDESTQVNGTILYEGCNLKAVLSWATSDRIIARQRVERTMKEIPEKVTIPAAQAGSKKPKTVEDEVQEMSDQEFDDFMTRLKAARKTA
jgi:hypothetical protein